MPKTCISCDNILKSKIEQQTGVCMFCQELKDAPTPISGSIKEQASFKLTANLQELSKSMLEKKEGIYIAYDHQLFEVLDELARVYNSDRASILQQALERGLHILIDEA